jgi:hypothetical protein
MAEPSRNKLGKSGWHSRNERTASQMRRLEHDEADRVVKDETVPQEVCSECGSPDHTDAEVALQELDNDIRYWNEKEDQ